MTASPQPYSRPSNTVSKMPPTSSDGWVWLQPNTEHPTFAESVSTTRNVSNLGRREHQVLVAISFATAAAHFGGDAPFQGLQFCFGGLVVQDEFAKLADRS